MRQSRRDAGAGGGAAFTLVELLIVICIIVLLVGILVPVVQTALLHAELTRCMAIVSRLGSSCQAYKTETGYYPGQQYINEIGEGPDADTGSQYLAKALFDEDKPWAPAFEAEDVFDEKGMDDSGGNVDLDDSLSDRLSEEMAVLYFPAKLGVKDTRQYIVHHNIEYVRASNGDDDEKILADFKNFIKDTLGNEPSTPRNPEKFLITAAGKDRLYFTGDDIMYPNR